MFARYSNDNWKSFKDVEAKYDSSNSYTSMDRFLFVLNVAHFFQDEKQNDISFAVCFESEGVQYWDNNNGLNYRVDFIQQKSPQPQQPVPQSPTGIESQPTQSVSKPKSTKQSLKPSLITSFSQISISQPKKLELFSPLSSYYLSSSSEDLVLLPQSPIFV